MPLRLHHSPLACSLASRIALEEAELAHELVIVRTAKGDHLSEEYGRINPLRKVPALETDQGVVTESTAILPLIADLAPGSALLPPSGTLARARAQSLLSYLSSTLHTAWTGVIKAESFEGLDPALVRSEFIRRLCRAFEHLDTLLGARDHLLDDFGICDIYLFVFLLWRGSPHVAGKLPPFPNLDRFQQAMLARPRIGAIMADEIRLMSAT